MRPERGWGEATAGPETVQAWYRAERVQSEYKVGPGRRWGEGTGWGQRGTVRYREGQGEASECPAVV